MAELVFERYGQVSVSIEDRCTVHMCRLSRVCRLPSHSVRVQSQSCGSSIIQIALCGK